MAKALIANPSKRRKSKRTKRKTTMPARSNVKRASPTKRKPTTKVRKFRRNPSPKKGDIVKNITKNIVPSAIAATGAVGVDIAWGLLPIPTDIKSGPLRHAAKAAGAIGFGALAHAVLPRDMADQMAAGALTVVMHDALKEMVNKMAPDLAMGEYVNIHDEVDEYSDLDLGDSNYADSLGDSTYNDMLNGWGDQVYDESVMI